MNHYLAIAGLVVVTIIWGGGLVASDMALESLLPFQIMAARNCIAVGIDTAKRPKNRKAFAHIYMEEQS